VSQATLTVANLRIAYGRIEVVHGISFVAPAGQATALIGPNGAGKTTTVRGIIGLQPPSGGTIALDDQMLVGRQPHQVARLGVALVPEGRQVFPSLSVLDNLRMGTVSRRARWRWPDGLEEVFALFPDLARLRDRPAGLLSGGEQQMLAIGRALMAKPRLLILDEPSMGLAPRLIERIYEALAALRQRGVSLLLAEQNARLALALSDRAYLLESGTIVESGPAAEMARSARVQEAYLGA
jgi:branched-chain amino acid transport system ATP-binding protein